jgi:CheY-like chemotaxis protein
MTARAARKCRKRKTRTQTCARVERGMGMARILVADDEPLIAMSIADWLADLGHSVDGPAASLTEALALVEGPIEAAILDVTLLDKTSLPVARRLLARGVPFAVATGHDVASLDEVFSAGLPLPKPFGFESFRQTVEKLLAQKHG